MSSLAQVLDSLEDLSCRLDGNRFATMRFRKTRKANAFGELCAFFPEASALKDDICEMLKESFEKAHPALRNALYFQLQTDSVYVTFNRPVMYYFGLQEILCNESQSRIDSNHDRKFQEVSVRCDVSGEDPTAWRCQTIASILTRVLKNNYHLELCGNQCAPNYLVSDRNNGHNDTNTTIFVGPLFCYGSSNDKTTRSSMLECRKAFVKEISIMSEHRLETDGEFPESDLNSLVDASLLFAVINGNISKPVTLNFDLNVAPVCKGAVFVMYNYCRMIHIIQKYRNLEKDGTYPPLPDLESINFGLLTKKGEWDMMFNFMLSWPQILKSTVNGIHKGDFKIHKVVEFLKSLSSVFSAYYRQTRVLTEPRPSLLPALQARIYFILGLMKVYKSALDIIALNPIKNM